MFQPTTECVDSLTIDDVTEQAVPESGTGRTECCETMVTGLIHCEECVFILTAFTNTHCAWLDLGGWLHTEMV